MNIKKEVAKAFNNTSKETRAAIDKIKNTIDDMIDNYVDYPSYKKKNESLWAQIDAVAKMACKDFGVSPNLSNKVEDYFLDYLWENSRYLDLVGG